MDFKFIVSKKTLSILYQELKNDNIDLPEYNPKVIINKSLCMGRTWNNGYGGQCSLKPVEKELCRLHYKQFQIGKLTHGRIDEKCPKKLPNLSKQPYESHKE